MVIALASIVVLAGISACSEEDETTSNITTGPKLLVDCTLTTIEVNEQGSVDSQPDDGKGDAIAFTTLAAGTCVVAQADTDQIVLTARGEACTDTVTVTAGDISTSLVVNAIDPAVMDIGEGLPIKYAIIHVNRWDDSGSGGDHDVVFWHPNAGGDGWYALDSYVRGDYTDVIATLDAAVVVVKDQGANDSLAAPTGFTFVWSDAGSGADRDGAAWNPICPRGYIALGTVVTSGAQPSTEDVRCVAERFAAPAKNSTFVYNDSGTDADRDITVYEVATPDFPT